MRRCLLPVLALLLAGIGCTGEKSAAKPEPAIEVSWREVTLPAPPGPPGRFVLRDAARCRDQWYVVGAVYSGVESRPAAWRSRDGRTWSSVAFAPQAYWPRRNVITSVACRGDTVAMIGSKPGGAHGNPRVSTWYTRADGVVVDVPAAPELYGGPHAVNVGRIAAGDPGWMIVGNRTSGAAVWTSRDATAFTLVADAPQLASDPTTVTLGVDVTYAGRSWTVVGSAGHDGRVGKAPMAWVSTDGTSWRRQAVPYGPDHADLQRVVPYRDGVLAVGVRGDTFGVWRRGGDTWRDVGRFGGVGSQATGVPSVASLTTINGGVVAAVSDGARYGLWASGDAGAHWRSVRTPTRPSNVGGQTMVALGFGDELLLLTDDGTNGRLWLADAIDLPA